MPSPGTPPSRPCGTTPPPTTARCPPTSWTTVSPPSCAKVSGRGALGASSSPAPADPHLARPQVSPETGRTTSPWPRASASTRTTRRRWQAPTCASAPRFKKAPLRAPPTHPHQCCSPAGAPAPPQLAFVSLGSPPQRDFSKNKGFYFCVFPPHLPLCESCCIATKHCGASSLLASPLSPVGHPGHA